MVMTSVPIVHAGLAALPVGGGGVSLGQAALDSFVQDVVDGVGAALGVAGGHAGGEGVHGLGHDDAHPVGVAGGAAADVGVPGAHGPAGGVVGVQGVDAGVVVAHLLQSVQELGGRLGDGGDASCPHRSVCVFGIVFS